MNNIMLIAIFVFSFLFFAAAVAFFIKNFKFEKNRSLAEKLVFPTIFTLVSVFALRFLTSYFGSILFISHELEDKNLNTAERLLNSFVSALQSFSLDDSYIKTITVGKDIFNEVFNSPVLTNTYGIFAALTNVFAPILGTAFVFGILTNIFPYLNLRSKPFREKYVFSELNERAIYLAESIIKTKINEKKNKKNIFKKLFTSLPLIIFTDAYIDKNREEPSELLYRSKKIGAICIKDDILQLRFRFPKRLWYILIDENDIENIHTLTDLTTKNIIDSNLKKYKYWNPKNPVCIFKKNNSSDNPRINIYIFSQNSEVSSIVRIINKIDKDKLLSNVVIKVVQEYTSIAYNLFDTVPLYKPLINKYKPTERKELTLTIFGSGLIGTEVFLGAYWCAQMLNCRLKINVIDKEAEKFKNKINYINPEILKSGIVYEKKDNKTFETKPDNDLLRIFPNQDKYSDPYASFYFRTANVESDDLINVLCDDDFALLKSDYFVVTVGDDKLNMTTAANISRIIQRKMLNGEIGDKTKPVIAYSIYNPSTKEILNNVKYKNEMVELHAFASLEDIYNYNNIFMKDISDKAYNISKTHTRKDMDAFIKDEYNWWSSIARTYHLKYKMFSIGLTYDENNKDNENKYREIVENIERKETNKVGNKIFTKFLLNRKRESDEQEKCRDLLWLEHRRWNAFMRTKGFTRPSDVQWYKYAYKDQIDIDNHKHLNLKLHPCLVECSKKELFNIKDNDWEDKDFRKNRNLDCLDIVSIMVYQHEKNPKGMESDNPERRDFKSYDDPFNDFKVID